MDLSQTQLLWEFLSKEEIPLSESGERSYYTSYGVCAERVHASEERGRGGHRSFFSPRQVLKKKRN
ncbi:hypothetical protein SCFA_740011 [anaerobic digester metagenome]|uniref:Uncharacterized protein n=1 Tax=anaerobic digester metagenome TaxID=1263854 RepID=A0A485M5F4_9ZZZZ